ncbi:GTPase ObgE [bacterium]|nr:GTPase ObgE [bacterium]
MFLDFIKISVKAGRGGNGIISFRREKYVPKGGPDGGDGGRGGDVVLLTDENLHTLQDVGHNRHYFAQNGESGLGNNQHGKNGNDVIIHVPPGTIVRNADSDEIIIDLVENRQRFVIAKGGRGGRGNTHFKSPTNRTPRRSEPGQAGEELEIALELKVLADVGLVGFPNAGKSTLLASVSAARPKIANYPFTTLTPNLGIVKVKDFTSLVMADIPGLIEGAHEGKGLGIQFLKHIERTKILAFLIDVQSDHIEKDYSILKKELKNFNPELLKRKRVVVLTKSDTVSKVPKKQIMRDGTKVMTISSVAQMGLEKLVQMLWKMMPK